MNILLVDGDQGAAGIYRVADLELDPHRKRVFRAGRRIDLTGTEYLLLELLVTNKNRILTRAFISEAIWGIHFERRTNLISVYINHLRTKIDKGAAKRLIYTIVNQGYLLREPDGV